MGNVMYSGISVSLLLSWFALTVCTLWIAVNYFLLKKEYHTTQTVQIKYSNYRHYMKNVILLEEKRLELKILQHNPASLYINLWL